MDLLIIVGLAVWIVVVVARRIYALVQRQREQAKQRELKRQAAALARRKAELELRQIALLDRQLRKALEQIQRSPDFRRAASFAQLARKLPAKRRQLFFRTYRPRLVGHFVRCLQAGTNPQALYQSLADLVTHLGVAPFEADYIRAEAEGKQQPPPPPAPVTYAQRLTGLQREHEQRMAALRQLTTLDQETLEQLVEAEQQRFREEIIALSEINPGAPQL